MITDSDYQLDIRYDNDETPLNPCKGHLELCCTSEEPKIREWRYNHSCGYRNINGVGYRKTEKKDYESQFGNIVV